MVSRERKREREMWRMTASVRLGIYGCLSHSVKLLSLLRSPPLSLFLSMCLWRILTISSVCRLCVLSAQIFTLNFRVNWCHIPAQPPPSPSSRVCACVCACDGVWNCKEKCRICVPTDPTLNQLIIPCLCGNIVIRGSLVTKLIIAIIIIIIFIFIVIGASFDSLCGRRRFVLNAKWGIPPRMQGQCVCVLVCCLNLASNWLKHIVGLYLANGITKIAPQSAPYGVRNWVTNTHTYPQCLHTYLI